MTYLKTFSTYVVAMALSGAAWAQIYETTDDKGNPVFTDSPASTDAQVVDLPKTNLADAPEAIPEPKMSAEATPAREQSTNAENNVVIENEDVYGGDGDYEDAVARARRKVEEDPLDRDAIPEELHTERSLDGEAPHEVLDGEQRQEVLEGEAPREVGDFHQPHRAIHPQR